MASNEVAAGEERSPQAALLECTSMYRVYVSAGISVKGKDGNRIAMKDPVNGLPDTGQIDIGVTPPDQIVAKEGFDPEGRKAIFLVRLPQDSQIFKP